MPRGRPRRPRHAAPWRGLTLGLALVTSVATLEVGTPGSAGAAVDDGTDLAQARALYTQGKAAYETFQYERAIELWTQSLAKLPAEEAGIRNRMVYNIATALEKQFEIDHDVERLRRAVLLLDSWMVNFKSMYKRTPETEAELQRAQTRRQELRDMIAAIERGENPAQVHPPNAGGATTPAEGTAGAAGGASKDVGFDSDFDDPPEVKQPPNPERAAAERQAKTFIIAGWVTLGVGGVFAIVGTGSLVGNRDTTFGLAAGITGTVIGVGLIATGSTLLGLGYTKRKRAAEGRYSVAPVLAPDTAGLVFSGRF